MVQAQLEEGRNNTHRAAHSAYSEPPELKAKLLVRHAVFFIPAPRARKSFCSVMGQGLEGWRFSYSAQAERAGDQDRRAPEHVHLASITKARREGAGLQHGHLGVGDSRVFARSRRAPAERVRDDARGVRHQPSRREPHRRNLYVQTYLTRSDNAGCDH